MSRGSHLGDLGARKRRFGAISVLAFGMVTFPQSAAMAQGPADELRSHAICVTVDPNIPGFLPKAHAFACPCRTPLIEVQGLVVTTRVTECWCLCAPNPTPENEAPRP
jgi:hypothetical protein